MWVGLVQLVWLAQFTAMILVDASVITYYMDDFKTCGAQINDANMDEEDVYRINSHQWSDTVSNTRYYPSTCMLAFDFISKTIKLDFESFRITDCDVALDISDGVTKDSPIITSLTCHSPTPEPIYTSSSGVRLFLKTESTKNYFFSIKVTAEGYMLQMTSGVVVGIVLGVVFLVLALVAAAVTFVICHRRNKMRKRMRLAYQSPAILEREEGLTIVNRLGVDYEEVPREPARPTHRRAYRSSFTSVASQHTPSEEGPPPYQSLPDLAHRNSRNSRASSRTSRIAEPEDVSDRSLTLTAADYPDGARTPNTSVTARDDVFLPPDHNTSLGSRGSPMRVPPRSVLAEVRSLVTEAAPAPAIEITPPVGNLNSTLAEVETLSNHSESSQTESVQNDSVVAVVSPTSGQQRDPLPVGDHRPRNILDHPAF